MFVRYMFSVTQRSVQIMFLIIQGLRQYMFSVIQRTVR